jgi:uncharacterized protein with PhoU and TrkA domain
MSLDKKPIFPGMLTVEKVAKIAQDLKKDWDLFNPEELADKIIDLEDQIEQLGSGRKVELIRGEAEHLHFHFVFPVALELETSEYSFAKAIDTIAKKILKTESVEAFYELNEVQQQEILRRCA